MALKNSRKKQTIELRYYELPEHEPVLALQGEEWVRSYGTRNEDLHFHNLMEVGLCHWGEGDLLLDGQRVGYQDGVVTFIPANCLHTTISRDGGLNSWSYLFFHPEPILREAFPENPLFVEAAVRRLAGASRCLAGSAASAFAALIELVLAEYRSKSDYHAEAVQSLMVSLLLLAARLSDSDENPMAAVTPGLRQIMPALEYMSRCYMNPVSVRELAAQCSLSEAHLRRKFREYLHMSPIEHLTIVRVRRAAELLKTTSYPVSEVALRVGYQSASSFERNFQRVTGFSPYQYKKHGRDYKGKLLEYKVSAKQGWKKIADE